MDRGYIKLWRKVKDKGILQDPDYFRFFCWCLLKASWNERTVLFNGVEVPLKPGEFIFGRKACSDDLKMSERKVRTNLQRLLRNEQISTIQTTSRYSILFVIKWHLYQGNENQGVQPNDQRPTSRRPAGDQQATTKKKLMKLRIEALKKITKPSCPKHEPILDDEALRLSKLLADGILKNNPNNVTLNNGKRDRTVKSWAKDIDKLHRIDGQNYPDIEKVIRWTQRDEFWSKNILSAGKLRKQWDQLWIKVNDPSRHKSHGTPERLN